MTTTDFENRSSDFATISVGTRLILWIIFIVCRLISLTWRVRYLGMDRRRMAVSSSPTGSFLLGSFHENTFAGVFGHAHQGICCMVSRSKDGDMTSFMMHKLGITTVRGSSSRGGKEVRDAMVRTVKDGVVGAITVDGPRGPRRVLKKGIVDIARKTGAPILPLTAYGESSWIFKKTWDQTRIPKPFSRVLVYYGDPITIPRDARDEQFSGYVSKITDILNRNDDLVTLRFKEIWRSARPWTGQ